MAAETLAAGVLAWLGTYAIHSTLLLGLAWGLTALVSRSRRLADALPLVREGVWRTALLAGIATASVQVALRPDAPCVFTIDAPSAAVEDAVDAAPAVEIAASQPPASAPVVERTVSMDSAKASTALRGDVALEGVQTNTARSSPRSGPTSVRKDGPMGGIDASSATRPAREPAREIDAQRTPRASLAPRVAPAPPAQSVQSAQSVSAAPTVAASTLDEPADVVTNVPHSVSRTPTPSIAASSGGSTNQLVPSAASEPSLIDAPAPVASVDGASARRWTIALLGLWLAGVAFGGLRWLREWMSLRRTLHRRVVLDRGEAHETLARLCEKSGTRGVRLSSASGLSTPITVGVVRHEIVVPPRAMTQLSPDELEAMLAHELAHARRDDPLWLWIYRAFEVVLFFQPLNRIARVRLQDDAELSADDWAATQVAERVSLASCLTEIAGWIVHERQRLPAPAMAARGSRLSRRVHRLLDDEHHPERARRPHGLLLLAGSAAVGVALFGPGVSAQARGNDLEQLSAQSRGNDLDRASAQTLESGSDPFSTPTRGDEIAASSASSQDVDTDALTAPSPFATTRAEPFAVSSGTPLLAALTTSDAILPPGLIMPVVEGARAAARALACGLAFDEHGFGGAGDALTLAARAQHARNSASSRDRSGPGTSTPSPLPTWPAVKTPPSGLALRFVDDPSSRATLDVLRGVTTLAPAPLEALGVFDAAAVEPREHDAWQSSHDVLTALERELDALRADARRRQTTPCVSQRLDELANELSSLHEQHAALLGLVRELEEARNAADRIP